MHASTVHRVLVRAELNRLDRMDRPDRSADPSLRERPAGRARPRRCEEARRIPTGGGWRAHGRGHVPHDAKRTGVGYALRPLRGRCLLARRLQRSPRRRDRRLLDRVLRHAPTRGSLSAAWSSNVSSPTTGRATSAGSPPRSTQLGVRHSRTRPYRPQTNGKVERFNRTLARRLGLRARLPLRSRAPRPRRQVSVVSLSVMIEQCDRRGRRDACCRHAGASTFNERVGRAPTASSISGSRARTAGTTAGEDDDLGREPKTLER